MGFRMKEKRCPYCGTERVQRVCNIGGREVVLYVDNCDCVAKDFSERKVFQQKKLKREKIKSSYLAACFPRRQRGNRLKTIKSEHQSLLFDFCENFKPFKSKGFFFLGNVGNGKTTSMCSIGKELINKGFYKVYYGTMTDYLDRMQATYSENSKTDITELINEWSNADLILVDDFGRTKYTDKRLENTFQFFDKLYSSCTVFCVSANPEMLKKMKDIPDMQAILDRFNETLIKLPFLGQTKRKETK